MATLRSVLNRALDILGEERISGSTTELSEEYHLLLLGFLNEIKEELEDAHNWRVLRTTINVTVSAGTSSGTITGTNERSRLLRMQNEHAGEERALVFDITDPLNPIPVLEQDLNDFKYRQTVDTDSTSEEPVFFAVIQATDGTQELHVHPEVTTERTIAVTMIVPQAELAEDDLDVNIKVPARPLRQGLMFAAFQERGEELGPNARYSEVRYERAMNDAIASDAAEQGEYQLVPV